MNCSNCGTPNPEGSDQCETCGARLWSENFAAVAGLAGTQIPQGLHTMGIGDLMDETIHLFRLNFRTFIGIVAVLQVPLLILRLAQVAIAGPSISWFSYTRSGTDQPDWGAIAFSMLSNVALGMLSMIAMVLIEAALASVISQRYLGQRAGVRSAYRSMLACFWRLLGVAILAGIITSFLFITIVGIPFAVYFTVRWVLIVQAVVLDGTGVRGALSRSSSLIKGSWWKALGLGIVVVLAQYWMSILPAGLLGAMIGGVGAMISADAYVLVAITSTAIGSIFDMLAMPLTLTATTLFYFQLRARKEGFDLQLLNERLHQAEPQAIEARL